MAQEEHPFAEEPAHSLINLILNPRELILCVVGLNGSYKLAKSQAVAKKVVVTWA